LDLNVVFTFSFLYLIKIEPNDVELDDIVVVNSDKTIIENEEKLKLNMFKVLSLFEVKV